MCTLRGVETGWCALVGVCQNRGVCTCRGLPKQGDVDLSEVTTIRVPQTFRKIIATLSRVIKYTLDNLHKDYYTLFESQSVKTLQKIVQKKVYKMSDIWRLHEIISARLFMHTLYLRIESVYVFKVF